MRDDELLSVMRGSVARAVTLPILTYLVFLISITHPLS